MTIKQVQQQLIQEKKLSLNTDTMLCEQLFDYKNQVEVKAVFVPLNKMHMPLSNLLLMANGAPAYILPANEQDYFAFSPEQPETE